MFEKQEMSESLSDFSFSYTPNNKIFPYRMRNRENNKKNITNFSKLADSNKNMNLSDSQSSDDLEHLEEQLSLFYENLILLYKKKLYTNIIQEFEGKEDLLYKNSKMSFNIYILKIKCLFKLLKSRFEDILKIKNDAQNYFEVERIIYKLNYDFKKINLIINENDFSEYEIITQVYCKFLLIISVIKTKKDENMESFFYLNLGISMMKVYFIKQKVANDIKTYLIYARLLMLLINQVLADNNFNEALIYINLLLRICEVSSIKIKEKNLNKNYQNKFIILAGYALLFSGYCFEVNNNYDLVLNSYKQAYYLLNKNDITNNDLKHLFFYSQITDLSKMLLYKVNDKLIKELNERRRKIELEELYKKEAEYQREQEEKQYVLKLIANGFSANVDKFSLIQKKLYDNILTTKNQQIMKRLDDELISIIYKDQNNKKENSDLSINIKRNLCYYEIYNKLMSNQFRDYITKNKNFGFSNPQQQKNSLDTIQGYLNNKMKLNLKSNSSPYTIKKYKVEPKFKIKEMCISNNNNNNNNIYRNFSIDNNRINTETTYSYNTKTNFTNERTPKENRKKKINNKIILNFEGCMTQKYRPKSKINFKQKYYLGVSPYSDINSNNKTSKTNSSIFNKKSMKDSVNYENNAKSERLNSRKKSAIINTKNSKHGFSKAYFKKYCYLDSLTCKELDFQKTLLGTKNNNSKLYFSEYTNELNNCGKMQKEDVYKRYLVIKDKANSKFKEYKMDDVIKLKNMKNDPKIIGNIFKSFSSKYSQGKSAKNALNSVISKYINAKKGENRSLRYIDKEKVLEKNEDCLLNLNNGIEEIDYLLQVKTESIKKKK